MSNARKVMRVLRAAAKNPRGLAREAARLPLEREAARRIAALRAVELADLTGEADHVAVSVPLRSTQQEWSLAVAEQLVLQVLVRTRKCRTAFELGTFNGGTTRVLAEALPSDGKVWTLDLPPDGFGPTRQLKGLSAADVGAAYRTSPAASKITQLFGDSLDYDFEPYVDSADLVLVDAGHAYVNGFTDTKTACQLVRDGGIVLWDDFTPHYRGLVNGICDAMEGLQLGALIGTKLAVYVNDNEPPPT